MSATEPKVRIKVSSHQGEHRVTVVGDDGFEAELVGVQAAMLTIEPQELARLTLIIVEFDNEIKDIR